ncbi:MAG TPA: hypothetical protein VLB02_02555, partial [Candidatus Paceibacterota bacterium]|nr:hypothetical protein [Candidatus Paceibacterota bacterium]
MKKLLVLFLFLGISSVGFFLSPKEASTANPGVRTNTARAPITIINYYNQQMGFYESLPKGYNDDPAREWPLIIFLHGDGERGNGTTELSRVLGAGLPKVINEGAQLEYTVNGKLDSFVVIAPQLDAGSSEWHPYQVDAFIEYAKENYRIDTDRIYLTGLSLGAFGAHRYPKFSPAFAQKIAAVVATDGADAGTSIYTPDYPGGMAPLDACFVPANNVKTWFIWGDADGWIWTVNGALAALAACTPSAAPTKTTVYPGLGHGVWTQTYDPTNSYQTPNTYEWLLAQTRGTAPTPTPVPGNQAPTASAGSDQAITLPTSTVTLSGSGADADGIITSYVWTKVSGGAATIVSATTASTQVTGLVEGAYVFRLTVTDSSGGTATDEVQIAVTTAVTLMDPAARRIVITPEMLFNETLVGNEEKLFNEQGTLVLDASGNPLQTTRPAACKGVWEEPPVDRTCFHVNDTNSNKELAYPGKIIVDLGRTYKITDIYLYDDRGGTHAAGDTEPLQVWTGGPLKYTQKIATHNFEKENEWVRLSVTPTETRYLQLRFNDGHGFIGEVVLYGVPMGSTPSTAAVPTIKPNYTFEKMIGTNISFGMGQDANGTKYDDQWGTVRYFGGLRWTFDKNDNLTPLDGIALETITRMVQKGVGVYSVLMGAAWTMVDPTDPLYISEAYTSFSDRKAIDYTLCAGSKIVGGLPSCDTVAQDPASYAHKAWLSKRVAKRDYDLGVRMIELGNEPDGFWQNAGYYLPFETAAMVSADYDGHCNTLRYRGETVGVKNAAPGMKVVLPAVSQHDPRYLKAMEFWFEHNRPCAPTFPADVINFHTYATTLGYQFAGNTGVSMPPEAFGIREQSESFVQFRNRYAPHAEVAMSEFGVDTYYEQHPNPTHPWCGSTVYGNSWAYAPKVGPFDEKEVQGQWLARSYLEQAAAGLDFVNQFWLSDQYREEESCFTFTTAGVLRITNVTDYKPTYEPKVSWYYTQTLRTRLAGMQYESEKNVSNGLGTGTIRIMKFRSVATPSAVAYVLWSPTANNVTNPNFVLSLDTAASASVIELTK